MLLCGSLQSDRNPRVLLNQRLDSPHVEAHLQPKKTIKGNSSKHYLLLIITISSYSASSNCQFSCPSSGLLHRPCNAETQHTEQTLLLKYVWAEWLNNQIHIAFNSYIEFSCRTCQVEKKKNYEKVKFSTVSQEDFLPLQCILLSPLHLNQKFFLLLTM